MTPSERVARIEDIEQAYERARKMGENCSLLGASISWLLERAKRCEELEVLLAGEKKDKANQIERKRVANDYRQQFQEESRILREALEKIINCNALRDYEVAVSIAQEALAKVARQ